MMYFERDERSTSSGLLPSAGVFLWRRAAELLCLMALSGPVFGGEPASFGATVAAKAGGPSETRGSSRAGGSGKAGPSPRADEPGKAGRPAFLVPDDPLMNHLLAGMVRSKAKSAGWEPRMQGPGLFLGYRLASFLCQVRSCWYHQGVVMLYPVALLEPEAVAAKLFRFGVGLEGGAETTLQPERSWQHHQHMAGLLSLGIQYPWRVTPFVDFVVGMGILHRNLYNKDYFDFAYSFGLDVGTSIFVVGRFHVTASVGWRRWAVRSEIADLYADSWSMTAGIGF